MAHKSSALKDTALQTWVICIVIIGSALVLLFMYAIRAVLLQLVIAVILAFALAPLVRFLMKHGFNRVFAAITALLATVIILATLMAAIASPLITQGGDLINNAPRFVDNALKSPGLQRLDQKYHVIAKSKNISKEAPRLLGGSGTPVLGAVGSVFKAVSSFFVILILVLFMLIEGPSAWDQFTALLGKQHGEFVNKVVKKIMVAVSGFVNGNLFISLIAGIFTLLLLLILRVPYAFALAALVAIFDLIPLVGATLAAVVIGLVALTKGVVISLIAVAMLLAYQFVEGNIIQPIVYGKAVKLSQLLIMVASIIGALLGGIVGVLLAIPLAAALQIVVVEILRASGANLEPEVSNSVKD